MDENILNPPQDNGSFFVLKAKLQQPEYTLYIQAKIESDGPLSGGWLSSITPVTLL